MLSKPQKIFSKSGIPSKYYEMMQNILELEDSVKKLDDNQIQAKIVELKKEYNSKPDNKNSVVKSFSLTREMAWRKLGLKHFETQVVGGLVLNDGKIAEMKTGEGKTLVATLPACYQALSGKGVHIVTVNEYLAKRDKELLQNLYNSLGFSVGLVSEGMENQERQYNYACDITYTTNAELGFDYLRDLIIDSKNNRVLRDFYYCLIDEVDSVLIDEAQTPLILSNNLEIPGERYTKAIWAANQLVPNRHFSLKPRTKQVVMSESGLDLLKEIFQTSNLYDPKTPWIGFVENALRAKFFFQKDQDYIIQNNEIQIIDKFTGRIAKGRKWSNGLHQAIECKENVQISGETQAINSITYPSFFKMYEKLSGMTGTAKTSEKEFQQFYGLDVLVIPTNNPMKRIDHKDIIFETKKAKFKKVVEIIQNSYWQGRPVLVGTTTIEDSEILNQMIRDCNISPQLLNARPGNADIESLTVAESGLLNSVTIATNMAGRGTDIILGGNIKFLLTDFIKELVYGIINLIPQNNYMITCGLADFEDLLKDFYQLVKNYPIQSILNYFENIGDIESHVPQTTLDFKIRELYFIMKNASTNKLIDIKNLIQKLGGLLVIGTSRHESRRIDDQLRGRSGRQGDPGESYFIISLEDELLQTYNPNIFKPFQGLNRTDSFSGADYFALSRAINLLQEDIEKLFYENRKSSSSFEEVLEYQQYRYFFFRNCLLDYEDTPNLFLNLCSLTTNLTPINNNLYSDNLFAYANSLDNLILKNFSLNSQSFLYFSYIIALNLRFIYGTSFIKAFWRIVQKSILLEMDEKWVEFSERISLSKDTIGLQVYAQKDPLQEYKRKCEQEFRNFILELQKLIVKKVVLMNLHSLIFLGFRF
uniref:Protein translocase subunit SecA n=1 Tax=Eustigmatophyceae sp. Mont 10/10-1w TaxID=2506145 RepID=A0A3R5QS31_9STRA|nr:preprotein-translocase subunit a [Eustigmatophyceae sp. Mont 10/10-1w]QAA11715.1 preprotein-translocase subunit a [Eustigmatophyceae sp. Mont 10/10-1w]